MKKFLFLTLLIASIALKAQQDVYLKINHKLGNNAFSLGANAVNNLNNSFQFDRLEYYISEVTLVYDGAQDTTLSDLYFLVNASNNLNVLLGTFNFSTLESIKLGIGVDSARNHLDPTTYVGDHPLAMKTPSMHWGWAAGYRFIATEGKTGNNMSFGWELHAIGDKNYGYAEVITAGDVNGNDLVIALDADYEKALKDITVDASLLLHGENGDVVTLFRNFHTVVFTKGSPNISVLELEKIDFSMAPNPTNFSTKLILSDQLKDAIVNVTDLTGKVIYTEPIGDRQQLNLSVKTRGIYIVSLIYQGKVFKAEKLVIH